MLRYWDVDITFQELPDNVSLIFSMSGCKNNCEDCHWEGLNKRTYDFPQLNYSVIEKQLNRYHGYVTNILFMGGEWDSECLKDIMDPIRKHFPELAISLYSGKTFKELKNIICFEDWDYIKAGPYLKERGDLKDPNTNQILLDVRNKKNITYKFRR